MDDAASDPYHFLTKGSQVEVSSDEDGLNGAWFVATVIHPPPSISTSTSTSTSTAKKNKSLNHHTRNNLVYVEYHNLLTEDGSSRRLREYANVNYVRPSPHPDTNAAAASPSDFQLNDLVDAFYRDGWWTGIITQVLDDSNFVVNFQNPPDQIQFHFSDLRVHRKWVDGRWLLPEKQRTAGLMFTVGKKVEVCFETENLRDVWFPATVVKNLGNDSFVVEYQQPGIGELPALHKVTVDYLHIRPSPPHLRDKNFVLLEKVDAYYDFGWWTGVITKELADNRYNVFFKHTKKEREFIYSKVRPHMEWKGGKWFNTSQFQGDTDGRMSPLMDIDMQTTPTPSSIGKQSSSTMKIANLDCCGNQENSMTSKDETIDPIKKASVGQSESEVTVINDQAFGKTENLSHGKKVCSKRGKGIELKTPATNSSRKKGRLSNELKGLQASDEGGNGDLVKRRRQDNVEKEEGFMKELGGLVVVGLECNGKKGEQSGRNKKEAVMDKAGDAEFVAPKRKRGRPPKLQAPETLVTVGNDVGGKEAPAVGAEESPQQKNTDTVTPPLPSRLVPNENHRQGKTYSSKKGKRGKRRTISINTDSQDKEKEKGADDGGGNPVCDDHQYQPVSRMLPPQGEGEGDGRSPFVRSSPLWETIESMEAFRKIPQRPHFRPLLAEGVKESAREGLAIGCMVTYSTVVDKTRGLRSDHPRSAIEDCLETLLELEAHGFDVDLLRQRLTALLLIKDKQEEVEAQWKGVGEKIQEQDQQAEKIDEQIGDIDTQIRELEEKRRQLLLTKETRDSEIDVMKAAIQQHMTQLQLQFDGVAAAPLPSS